MPASISAREPTLGRQNIDAFILLPSPPYLVVIHHPEDDDHLRRADDEHQYIARLALVARSRKSPAPIAGSRFNPGISRSHKIQRGRAVRSDNVPAATCQTPGIRKWR